MTYKEIIQKVQLYDKDAKITTKIKFPYIAYKRRKEKEKKRLVKKEIIISRFNV